MMMSKAHLPCPTIICTFLTFGNHFCDSCSRQGYRALF